MPVSPATSQGTAVDLRGRVFRYLRSLVGDSEVARDLTQDLHLKLHDRPSAGVAQWFTAARNLALSPLRSRAVQRRRPLGAVWIPVGNGSTD